MSGVHLHLLVNHVPIVGAYFALALLAGSLLYARDVLQRLALGLLVVVAIVGGIAKLSGDPAEHAVTGMPGVTRAMIHEHEDMADKAFIAAVIVGVGALFCLVRWRQLPIPTGAVAGCTAGTVVVAGLMAYAGLLGGEVRHVEVRPGATPGDAIAIEAPRQRRPPGAPADSSRPTPP
jgi:hypothetical protein